MARAGLCALAACVLASCVFSCAALEAAAAPRGWNSYPYGSVNVTYIRITFVGEPLVRQGDSIIIDYDVYGTAVEASDSDAMRAATHGDEAAAPAEPVLLWLFANFKQWGAPAPLVFEKNSTGGLQARGSMPLPLPFPVSTTIQGCVLAGNAPPSMLNGTRVAVGAPIPRYESPGTTISQAVVIAVSKTAPQRPAPRDPHHAVSLFWEPWFTPHNFKGAGGGTAESVPALGYYDSFDAGVIRQHALWFVEMGVDVLGVDWTNNLWGKSSFAQRGVQAQEIINATVAAVRQYDELRSQEGWDVPRFVMLLGLNNGPSTTLDAITEEMDWVAENIIAPYPESAVQYEGKPLIVVFDGSGADHSSFTHPAFTVRWMASQLQGTHFDLKGYWSWMDGSIAPPITKHAGAAEAVTVTPAYFAGGGWLGAQAAARNGGATLAAEVSSVLQRAPGSTAPAFLHVCQWNEFAGQPNGGGYGPNHSSYVDSYSPNLSNDLEPTRYDLCAYARPGRHCGGYSWQPANLLAALLDMYRAQVWPQGSAPAFNSTLLLMESPNDGTVLPAGTTQVNVSWVVVGAPFDGPFSVTVNGKVAASPASGSSAMVDLIGVDSSAGIELSVQARGGTTLYPLSHSLMDRAPTPEAGTPTATATVYIAS